MTTTTVTSVLTTITKLRTVLGVDAVVTGLNGAAYLVAGSVLDDALGVPAGLVRAVGAFLLAYAVAVWAIRTPATISHGLAYGVVVANVAWAWQASAS